MVDRELSMLIDGLESELDLIDPKLRDWNQKYFRAQKRRYMRDLETIQKYYSVGDILEVGSLPCHLTYCLKKLGYSVVGMDLDPERAGGFIAKHDLNIVKCNIESERIPFDNNRFDLIIFNEIFEHLRIDPISTLKEISRVLTNNGILVVTTPNLYSMIRIFRYLTGRGLDNPYQEFEKLHTLGHMGHVRIYSKDDVAQFLNNTGFRLIDVEYRYYSMANRGIKGKLADCIFTMAPRRLRPYLVLIAKKH